MRRLKLLRNALIICNMAAIVTVCSSLIGLFNFLPLLETIQLNSLAETKLLIVVLAGASLIFVAFISFYSYLDKEYAREFLLIKDIPDYSNNVVKYDAILQKIDISGSGYTLHIRRLGRKVFAEKVFLLQGDSILLFELLGLSDKLKIKVIDNIEKDLISVILNYYLKKEKGIVDNVPVRIESFCGKIIDISKEAEGDINASDQYSGRA